MTGWRVGWIILPQGLTDQMDRLIEFNTSGGQSFLQRGCIAAIREGEPWVKWMVERCKRGRDLVLDRLSAMNRVSVIPADASFYLMLKVEEMGDPVEFCKRLVREARVGLAPGHRLRRRRRAVSAAVLRPGRGPPGRGDGPAGRRSWATRSG